MKRKWNWIGIRRGLEWVEAFTRKPAEILEAVVADMILKWVLCGVDPLLRSKAWEGWLTHSCSSHHYLCRWQRGSFSSLVKRMTDGRMDQTAAASVLNFPLVITRLRREFHQAENVVNGMIEHRCCRVVICLWLPSFLAIWACLFCLRLRSWMIPRWRKITLFKPYYFSHKITLFSVLIKILLFNQ